MIARPFTGHCRAEVQHSVDRIDSTCLIFLSSPLLFETGCEICWGGWDSVQERPSGVQVQGTTVDIFAP